MTPVYEANTVHTEKTLEDFVKFTFKISHPATTFSLTMMGICFYTLTFLGRNTLSRVTLTILLLLGTFFVVFAFNRYRFGVSKLKQSDPNYINQTNIKYVFGEKEFTIEDAEGLQHRKYGEIPYMYADDEYFYISVNNEMMHLIPRRSFILGSESDFYKFFQEKTGKNFVPVRIPWKTKIQLMMQYRDMKYEERQRQKQQKNQKN